MKQSFCIFFIYLFSDIVLALISIQNNMLSQFLFNKITRSNSLQRSLASHRSLKTRYSKKLKARQSDKYLNDQFFEESLDKQPLIPRFGNYENYAAKWQAQGDYYVSYENLRALNDQLVRFERNRSRNEKTNLLSELTLTYFARFHNIIREEYQFERKLVEERLATWSRQRLAKEGYSLFDLSVSPKGNLYQDKVFRFRPSRPDDEERVKRSSENLPFHRFSVGDTVRLSLTTSVKGALGESALDGVVLDRRQKYLDICLKASETENLDISKNYRLDCFVNRVSYDRMLESLQIFLKSGKDKDGEGSDVSRTLKDLILYSYPNSLIRLARSPGGLKLALPLLSGENEGFKGLKEGNRVVRSEDVVFSNSSSSLVIENEEVTETTDNETTGLNSYHRTRIQLTQKLDPKFKTTLYGTSSSSKPTSKSRVLDNSTGLLNESIPEIDNTAVVTVAEALQQLKDGASTRKKGAELRETERIKYERMLNFNSQKLEVRQKYGEEVSAKKRFPAVFETNQRLQQMLLGDSLHLNPIPQSTPDTQTLETQYPDPENPLTQTPETSEAKGSNSRATVAEYKQFEVIRAIQTIQEAVKEGKGKKSFLNSTGVGFEQNRPWLNPSQLNAIEAALLRPLSLIQGPPGTGKTKTACTLIAAALEIKEDRMIRGGTRSRGLKNKRILACAHSNVATDNLLDGLISLFSAKGKGYSNKIVRVGRPVNVRSELWNYTLDARLQENSLWLYHRAELDTAVEEYRAAKLIGGQLLGDAQRQLGAKKKVFGIMEKRCISAILNDAEVVVASTVGAGSDTIRQLNSGDSSFDLVVVDEAAQCTEAALLPALVHGCERLVLIGDQNQLPPVVLSPISLEHGLGVSLFSRLLAAGLTPFLLDEQYRMHPYIAKFPSTHFYGGRVRSAPHLADPKQRPRPDGFPWPHPHLPIAFVDVSPWVGQQGKGESQVIKCVETERGQPCLFVKEVKEEDDSDEVGFISETTDFTDNNEFNESKGEFNKDEGAVPIGGGFEVISDTAQASYSNQVEAVVVTAAIRSFLDNNEDDYISKNLLSLDNIGVISPYNAQVRALRDLFLTEGWVEASVFSSGAGGSPGEGEAPFSATASEAASGEFGEKMTSRYKKKLAARIESEDLVKQFNSEKMIGKNGVKVEVEEGEEVEFEVSAEGRKEMSTEEFFKLRESTVGVSDFNETIVSSDDDSLMIDATDDEIVRLLDKMVEDDFNLSRNLSNLNKTTAYSSTEVEPEPELNPVNQLEVRSVDGFQGREKDLIIISAVRSNRLGRVGFLNDWRRLNVAITRAKRGLIVVGDSSTLRNERHWRAFIDWCRREGCYTGVEIDDKILQEVKKKVQPSVREVKGGRREIEGFSKKRTGRKRDKL